MISPDLDAVHVKGQTVCTEEDTVTLQARQGRGDDHLVLQGRVSV